MNSNEARLFELASKGDRLYETNAEASLEWRAAAQAKTRTRGLTTQRLGPQVRSPLLFALLFSLVFGGAWWVAHPVLAANATITGTVTGPDSKAVENMGVTVYRRNEQNGFFDVVFGTATNATGGFSASGLTAGTYRVGFTDDIYPRRYVPQFYHNASDLETATNIAVANGATVTKIDAQLSAGARISGLVTNQEGQALENISVRVYQELDGWANAGEVRTAANGQYSIQGLAAGAYRIGFFDYGGPPQYIEEFYASAATLETATTIQLAAEQTVTNIDAHLTPFSHITGLVTAASNQPISDVRITAYLSYTDTLGLRDWRSVSEAVTDATGLYNLGNLRPGIYRVEFGTYSLPYAGEFYDDASDLLGATDIPVGRNVTVPHINAQLALYGHITGKVTDKSGNGLTNIFVQALRREIDLANQVNWRSISSAQTNAAGDYDVSGLTAGIYHIQFEDPNGNYITEYYGDAATVEQGRDIPVNTNTTVQAINAQLVGYSQITGKVTDANSQPIASVVVTARRAYTDTLGNVTWQPAGSGWTDDSGNYAIKQLAAGQYQVKFEDSMGRYVSEYYADALTEPETQLLTVPSDATVANINAQLASFSHITGQVTDLKGIPLPGILVSAHHRVDESGWYFAGSAQTDPAGHYNLSNLLAGIYRIEFGDLSGGLHHVRQFYDHAPDLASATNITVGVGITVTAINAQLAQPTSQIRGKVINEAGQPLRDIWVTLFGQSIDGAGNHAWYNLGTTQTSADGLYTAGRLAPGVYRLGFADARATPQYHVKFYPDAAYVEHATDIGVGIDATVTGIDVRLAPLGALNAAPLALPDSLTIFEGSATNKLDSGADSVLINDKDAEGQSLMARLVNKPVVGTLILNLDGTLAYTHDGSESIQDRFTYLVNDGVHDSHITIVTVTIKPVNDAPVATDDTIQVSRGVTVTLSSQSLLNNDLDAEGNVLTVTIVTNPTHGQLTPATGSFLYRHDGSTATSDSFTYRLSDGQALSNTATVTLLVAPREAAPPRLFLPLVRR